MTECLDLIYTQKHASKHTDGYTAIFRLLMKDGFLRSCCRFLHMSSGKKHGLRIRFAAKPMSYEADACCCLLVAHESEHLCIESATAGSLVTDDGGVDGYYISGVD